MLEAHFRQKNIATFGASMMPRHDASVLLLGDDSDFLDFAAFHLRSVGLETVAVRREADLEAMLTPRPVLVLVHWDTLGEACFRACARLKPYLQARGVPVAIISETLAGRVDILTAFASGADALIEGAQNPRIFLPRVAALLGRRGVLKGASPRTGAPA